MSTQQRENLEAILRQSAFPADIDLNEQRRLLRELISAQPLNKCSQSAFESSSSLSDKVRKVSNSARDPRAMPSD